MKPIIVWTCFLAVFAFPAITLGANEPLTHIVQLKHGKVHGKVVHLASKNKTIEFFEAIKYAEAKRFEKPTEVHPWPEVYPATSKRDACYQFGLDPSLEALLNNLVKSFSEDCLYLNIWRPAEVKANRSVIVYIHGGAFEAGTIFLDGLTGEALASQGDLIVVAINYRLGPLGFASGGSVPPNLGLLDQIFALRWVKENIAAFGGNPADVTISGGSAGSISVGALILSPLTKGLFHRAIMQSGAPTAEFVAESLNRSMEKTQLMAKKVNCSVDLYLTSKTMHCLATKSIKDLKAAQVGDFLANNFFVPVYGDEVMPVKPDVALKTGRFNKVDLIYGVTRNEGSSFAAPILPEMANPSYNYTVETAKAAILKMLAIYRVSRGEAFEIADFYLTNGTHFTQNQFRVALSNVWGDRHLVCPTVLMAEEMARHNQPLSSPQNGDKPSKFYAYRLMQSFEPPPTGTPAWVGVTHGQDGSFIFPDPAKHLSPVQKQLSDNMIQAWAAFAKTGTPTSMKTESSRNGIVWEEAFKSVGSATRYLHLEANHYHMVDDYWKDSCDRFWKPKIFT